MRLTRLRRIVAGGATIALGAAGLVGFTALNAVPAGAVTNANTTYELDCTTSFQAGVVAPFAITANLNTTTDTAAPTGATFGVTGAVTATLVGPFIAAFAQNGVLNSSGLGVDLSGLTIGSTDGTATGSYSASGSVAQSPSNVNSSALTGVSFSSGATSVSYTGGTVAVGDGVAGTGMPQGAEVVAVGSGTFTLSAATTAASSGNYTAYAASEFTFPVTSPTNAFTTHGSNGGTASVGVTGMTSLTAVIALPLQFGGAQGVGTSNCLETGYDASNNPGPAQTGSATPAFPPPSLGGPGTPLVASTGGFLAQSGTTQQITPPAAATVNLVDTPPSPKSATLSINVSSSGSFNLSATAGSYPVDPNGYSLVGGSPQTIGNLTLTQVGTSSQVNYVDTDTNVASYTLQFNACDTLAAGLGGPVCSTSPGTIHIVVAPPTLQPLSVQVGAGSLQLSCDAPAVYVSGNNPLANCPEFPFPAITLNGLEQQVSATTASPGGSPTSANPGTIYISDNRGNPAAGWNFSAFFVASGSNNSNTDCANVVAFCDEDLGSGVATTPNSNGFFNGQIAPNYLAVSLITCAADSTGGPAGYNPPNLNSDATATTGFQFSANPQTLCSATAGNSGGTFLYNAKYTLTIPESVFAGNYVGTIQYLAS